jgi:predicted outer membrane lipoprotein
MQTTPPGPADAAVFDRFASSPVSWILAGLLALAAAYLIIRLLELDLVNEETPHQEEPLPR